jgi:hypothetical protein
MTAEKLDMPAEGSAGAFAEGGESPPSGGLVESRAHGGARPADDPEAEATPSPSPGDGGPAAGAAPLRAGSTDDNADYEKFLAFLAEWGDREGAPGNYQLLDVADRRHVRVVNDAGRPVPAAEVRIVDEAADRILLSGTTYGDGRVPFYPHVTESQEASLPVSFSPDKSLVVEVSRSGARRLVRWNGLEEELVVKLDVAEPVEEPIRLDVLLLIDTTGSMSDEIERIKASLLGMTAKLRSLEREFDLRYAAVLYRDIGDEYVTKSHPFTGDIEGFDRALKGIRADGGGDGPESLNQGLAEAVGRANWREGAAKVAFLIADAPPHMDYPGDVPYGESLQAALAAGIRIHSVAASGLDQYEVGALVFRQIAQFTRGKFIFIEYGTPAESAARHGVTGEVKSNNLDDILFEQLREEVARWGR